jgi:uncharacterized membrane protein
MMSLPRLLALYVLTLGGFLAVDLLWLGILARGFYARHLGDMLRPDVNWGAAFLFYGIYVAGVLILAVFPALEARSLGRALMLGAVLGFVAYAAYDLTSLAVMRDFPAGMVPVDMIWGTILTATTAAVGYGAGRWLLG